MPLSPEAYGKFPLWVEASREEMGEISLPTRSLSAWDVQARRRAGEIGGGGRGIVGDGEVGGERGNGRE